MGLNRSYAQLYILEYDLRIAYNLSQILEPI